jgi:hypothetical protein
MSSACCSNVGVKLDADQHLENLTNAVGMKVELIIIKFMRYINALSVDCDKEGAYLEMGSGRCLRFESS